MLETRKKTERVQKQREDSRVEEISEYHPFIHFPTPKHTDINI